MGDVCRLLRARESWTAQADGVTGPHVVQHAMAERRSAHTLSARLLHLVAQNVRGQTQASRRERVAQIRVPLIAQASTQPTAIAAWNVGVAHSRALSWLQSQRNMVAVLRRVRLQTVQQNCGHATLRRVQWTAQADGEAGPHAVQYAIPVRDPGSTPSKLQLPMVEAVQRATLSMVLNKQSPAIPKRVLQ